MSEPRLRVLNLGAGVQSTTLALIANQGMKQAQYLHRTCQPLDEVLLPGDEGQIELFALDKEGAENECTGYCWT